MSKSKKYMFLVILILGAILLLINGFTYARYASNSMWNYYLKSKGFYFDSEYLSMSGTKNINNMWDGGNVYFTITNSLNQSVATEYDINYEVKCTVVGTSAELNTCYMNGTSSNTYQGVLSKYLGCINTTGDGVDVSSYNQSSCEIAGYNFEIQPASKELYFNVVNNAGEVVNDVEVNITATSTSPYKKVLNGNFILHKTVSNDGKVDLNYYSNQDYERLVVSNSYSETRCVHITWNADDLLIDIDPSSLISYSTDENGYINEIRFNLLAKDSLRYIFYKRNINSVIDANSFVIEDNNAC